MPDILGDGRLVAGTARKLFGLGEQLNCHRLHFIHHMHVEQMSIRVGHAGIYQPLEHPGVDQLLKRRVHGLQQDFFQSFFDARHPAPVQVGCQMRILVPLVILHFTKVQEDVVLVCAQFCVQPCVEQLVAASNKLQAGHMVPENTEVISIGVQSQTLS